jgi:sulfotransferase family protein
VNARGPLILISAARSGSKLLRDLLGASPACAVVPFDVNFVWRHGNEDRPDDALPAEAAGPLQVKYIRRAIPRLAGVRSSGDGRLVVEKTVSNSLRVPFVARVFPEARYVHLVRDGRAVAESTRRVWHERPARGYLLSKLRYFPLNDFRYAIWYLRNRWRARAQEGHAMIWGPRYPGIEEDLRSLDLLAVCARQWAVCNERARAGLRQLPVGQVFELRYEDLVDGDDRLSALCDFAGIDDAAPILAARGREVEPGYRDRWRSALSNEEQERLKSSIGPLLHELGYST